MERSPNPPSIQKIRNEPAAVWSLVLGILSLTCFSILSGIPAVICGHVAQGKIRRSGGLLTGSGMAIAGLVTGYLSIAMGLFFIPLMLSIAVPNFVKARAVAQKNACINNLRQIDSAVQMWALEHKKPAESKPTLDDLKPYLTETLVCPAGGSYQLGMVSEKPTCSIADHKLPDPLESQ